VLRPIVDIRPHEVSPALLLSADLFIRLLAYYLLKTARDVLILGAPGARAELKAYASAEQALLLIVLALAFGSAASRFRRRTLLLLVNGFFILQLIVFGVVLLIGTSHELAVAVVFFMWLGCFNVFMNAQFWSFASDVYNPEDGGRLFPLVALGGSLGAVVGAELAKLLLRRLNIGLSLIAGAFMLMISVSLDFRVDRLATGGSSAPAVPRTSLITLIRSERFLAVIAVLVLVKNWLNALGEYALDRRLLASLPHLATRAVTQAYIAEFKASYVMYASVLAVVIQLLVASRMLRVFGVGRSLCVLPLFVALGYSSALAVPALGLLLAVKVGENGLDYSLQKTAEQALYLGAPRTARYKASAIANTVFVRFGDVVAALSLAVLLALSVPFRGILATALLLALATLAVSLKLSRLQRQRAAKVDTRSAPRADPLSLRLSPPAGQEWPSSARARRAWRWPRVRPPEASEPTLLPRRPR
jgi:AAA family ATP:ADP antiporter